MSGQVAAIDTRYSASHRLERDKRRQALGSQVWEHVFGPVPLRRFMSKFLQLPDMDQAVRDLQEEKPGLLVQFKAKLPNELISERKRVQARVSGVLRECNAPLTRTPQIQLIDDHTLCPGMFAVDTQSARSNSSGTLLGTDCMLYSRKVVGIDNEAVKSFIEVKRTSKMDPFVEDGGFLHIDDIGDRAGHAGQSHDYARSVLHSNSERTHLFSLYLAGESARVYRWDRSSTTVSEAFNYVAEPYHLAAILKALSRADPSVRGRDTTVETLSSDEAQRLRDDPDFQSKVSDLRAQLRLNSDVDKSLQRLAGTNPSGASELVRFRVRDSNSAASIECIGSIAPAVKGERLYGRATRGWVVWNVAERAFAWYKRQWRVVKEGVHAETDTYEKLRAAGVEHIPTVIGGGDLVGATQLTALKDLEKEPWVAPGFLEEINHYQHCDLLLKEVGIPLTDFKSSRAVTSALLCAVKGTFLPKHMFASCSSVRYQP
jgi:hypothetical protein